MEKEPFIERSNDSKTPFIERSNDSNSSLYEDQGLNRPHKAQRSPLRIRIVSGFVFTCGTIVCVLWLVSKLLDFIHSWTSSNIYETEPASNGLQFQGDRFKIAVFSDLHYGEAEDQVWGPIQDRNSTRVMNHVLADEHPDFVSVFAGDQVTGENLKVSNATNYLDLVFEATVQHGIPFASVYGNHDNSPAVTHTRLYKYEKDRYENLSLTKSDPSSATDSNGIYNYYLPVFRKQHDPIPSVILWFFDSRSGMHDNPNDYEDWVDPAVEQWIKKSVNFIISKYKELPPSIAFVHIPPTAAASIQAETVTPNPKYPGLNEDRPVDCQGQHHPNVFNPDRAFWNGLTRIIGGSNGSQLIATVVGHDHGNSWCAKSKGMVPTYLCFAAHTGYGGYGRWDRGSRILELKLGESGIVVQTWLRMENHSVLNGTILRGRS